MTTAGKIPLQLDDRGRRVLFRKMGVHVGGHFDGGMAQQVLGGFQVDARLVQIRAIAVPLRYNKFVQFLSVSTPSLCADKPWYFRMFSI